MVDFVKIKSGSNRTRAERAVMDNAFDSIRDRQLIETRPEHFLRVLEFKKVSTNNYLRRFHNFAVDMGIGQHDRAFVQAAVIGQCPLIILPVES